jgi:tetratricopeptide (TPR) repeat protein
LQTIRGVEMSVYTDSQGRFEFTRLSPGSYEILVEGDKQRYEPVLERVEVLRGLPAVLTLILKERGAVKQPRASTVSVSELEHKIPKAALKEFERATRASQQGDHEVAIDHFKRALAIDPDYLMAHNDLGAQLLQQGRLDEAAGEFQRAIALDPKAFNPLLNLGIVQVQQQRFAEAAETLNKALALEADSPAAKLYHGLALVGLDDLSGAERELKTAHEIGGVTFAIALFHLGQLYMNRGQRDQAVISLESYLHEAPNAGNAPEVRRLLAMLR